MNTISINYSLIYRFKNYQHIQVTKCGKVFNTKTGRVKKMCYNGGSIGLWLEPRLFVLKSNLNDMLEIIPLSYF